MSMIGLLGGTFDPVHKGHLELAERACQECGLERVIFIPAAAPPHKSRTELTPFHQRVEMLKLAIGDRRHFSISKVESAIRPPSYTIDMLDALLPPGRPEYDYHFIIGSDAFLEVKTWKCYKKVLQRLHFIVVPRKGFNSELLKEHIASLGYWNSGNCWYNNEFNRKLYCLTRPAIDISSTEIREMTCGSQEMRGVVPRSVYEYIVNNRLYRCAG